MERLQALRALAKWNQSSDGYSLVEIIVAMAIGLTLMISLSSALITQKRDETSLRQTIEAGAIENDVRLLLNNPATCTNTLALVGTTPPMSPVNLSVIRDGTGATVLAAPKIFANLVRLRSMSIVTVVRPVVVGGRWQLELTLNVEPVNGTTILAPRIVEVYVDVDRQTGAMTGCSVGSISNAPPYNCVRRSVTVGGRTAYVSCPANYRVVSCGMADSDPDKNDWRRMVPQPNSDRCYCYDNDPGGSLTCHVLCCRG